MAVIAKFVVIEVKKSLWQGQSGKPSEVVVLGAAHGEENKEWSKYTPNGRIEMTIDNPKAVEQFECGKEFFVTFEAAPAKAE